VRSLQVPGAPSYRLLSGSTEQRLVAVPNCAHAQMLLEFQAGFSNGGAALRDWPDSLWEDSVNSLGTGAGGNITWM
jgi:hypothetical protein